MNVSLFERPASQANHPPTSIPSTGRAMNATISRMALVPHCRRSHGQDNAWCDNPTHRQTYDSPEYRQDGSGDAAAPTDGEHQGAEGGHQDVELVNRRQPASTR